MSDNICSKCRKKYHSGEEWVQCDLGEEWFHFTCANIPSGSTINGVFHCDPCKTDLRKQHREFEAMKRKVLDLEKEQTTLKTIVSNHDKQFAEFQKAITMFTEVVHAKADISTTNTISETVNDLRSENSALKQRIDDQMNEPQERERKARNVIIRNVPNLNGNDNTMVEEILTRLDITGKVIRCGRLGPKDSDRKLPIRVEFQAKTTAETLLTRAHQLKDDTDFNTVYINPDLTKLQQDRLEEELEARFDKGEDVTIVGCRVRPWRNRERRNPRLVAYLERKERAQGHGSVNRRDNNVTEIGIAAETALPHDPEDYPQSTERTAVGRKPGAAAYPKKSSAGSTGRPQPTNTTTPRDSRQTDENHLGYFKEPSRRKAVKESVQTDEGSLSTNQSSRNRGGRHTSGNFFEVLSQSGSETVRIPPIAEKNETNTVNMSFLDAIRHGKQAAQLNKDKPPRPPANRPSA